MVLTEKHRTCISRQALEGVEIAAFIKRRNKCNLAGDRLKSILAGGRLKPDSAEDRLKNNMMLLNSKKEFFQPGVIQSTPQRITYD